MLILSSLLFLFVALLLNVVLSIYVCDENDVVRTVRFEKQPRCPSAKKTQQTNSLNGTAYLFKPNFKKYTQRAHRCRLHVTKITTKRDCAYWLCSESKIPLYEHYIESVSEETCLEWVQNEKCSDCLQSDAGFQKEANCHFVDLSGELKTTLLKGNPQWEDTSFGPAEWSGTLKNCEVSRGNVVLKRPWNVIASSWGTLSFMGTEPLRELDYHLAYRDAVMTVVWLKPVNNESQCNYALHTENGAHLVSYGEDDLNNSYTHVVIPELQTSFSLLLNMRHEYETHTDMNCPDNVLVNNVDTATVYALAGDLIVVFVPIETAGLISVTSRQTALQHPIHGHVVKEDLKSALEGAADSTIRDKRDLSGAADAAASVASAKLDYFVNLFSKYRYNDARQLAEVICKTTLQIYDMWKLQADIQPSLVISHLLKTNVIARRNGMGFYDILPCADLSPSDYFVLPSMRDPANKDKCYSRPLVSLRNNNTAQSVLATQDLTFQLSKEKNRVVFPPLYLERCSLKPNISHTFTIDGVVYKYQNYELLDSEEKNNLSVQHPVQIISPSFSSDILYRPQTIDHIPLFRAGEISISFQDTIEVMDYLNRELESFSKYGRQSELLEIVGRSFVGFGIDVDIIQLLSSTLERLYELFLNPLLQFLGLIFICVPILNGWFGLITSCCRFDNTKTVYI